MRSKLTLFLLLLTCLAAGSCSDTSMTRNLYDDWWPIHATGSRENESFRAQWDGDLNSNGAIEVTYVSKANPSLAYTDLIYFNALSFNSDKKTFRYAYINSMEITFSKALKYYIEKKIIYFEKMNNLGRGSGEYDSGKDLSFIDKDHVKIGGITYERFSVYYESHRAKSSQLRIEPDGRIAVQMNE